MTAPVSPAVSDAAASPGGIRYVSLHPADNPAGANAFLNLSPLYNFGPITVGPDSARGTWGIISYKYLASNLSTDSGLVYNMAKWLDVNYDKYKASGFTLLGVRDINAPLPPATLYCGENPFEAR